MLSRIQIQNSKCKTLESPRKIYDKFLFLTNDQFGDREKEAFAFSFRDALPCAVLETRNPLLWFQRLEQRGKLSWKDISSLADFFDEASFHDLESLAQHYQARIKVISFLQKHLQEKLPEMCLDDKLNEKWSSEEDLPKIYLKRCQELFRGTRNSSESVNRIRSLFSKGVSLLVKRCSTPTNDGAQIACLKLLYLADQFYVRFKEVIIADKELLNIKLLPSGKFRAYDNRGRMLVTQRSESLTQVEGLHQFAQPRGSSVVISFTAIIAMLFSCSLGLCLVCVAMILSD